MPKFGGEEMFVRPKIKEIKRRRENMGWSQHRLSMQAGLFENEENLLPGAMSMSQFIDTIKAL